jgi:hypothetical protein
VSRFSSFLMLARGFLPVHRDRARYPRPDA